MSREWTEYYIETHFSENMCATVDQAIKLEFPNIKNLEVEMDETGTCHIIFEETEYTQQQVQDFLTKLRKINSQP